MRTTAIAIRAALFGAVTLAACAPVLSTGVHTAPDIRSAVYRTFSWEMPDQFPTGDPRLDNNPFFIRELQNAVASQLYVAGLREESNGADLTVHFHATVRNRIDIYETDRRAGFDQPGSAQQVLQYEEGTILVDVAERGTRKLIWRGWMQTDITSAIADRDELGTRVRRGMTVLFTRFPTGIVAK